MPNIVTLNYTMLHNPSLETRYYVDDDQQPVAEFVCGISEIMHQHTDDILVVSTTQLPSLEDPLRRHSHECLLVGRLRYIDHPDFAWSWSRDLILSMANVQRGKVTRIYDIQNTTFMWEECDKDQETGLRGGVLEEERSIRRHARNISPFMDVLVKNLQTEYALSLRGGARAQRLNDPRAAMTAWALARVEKDMPSLPATTAGMLLKAESRTVTAVLSARTSKQVVEVMQAAMRRAGIPVSQISQPAAAAPNHWTKCTSTSSSLRCMRSNPAACSPSFVSPASYSSS